MATLPNVEPLETNHIFLVVSDHSSFARNDRVLWFVERLLAATSFEAVEVCPFLTLHAPALASPLPCNLARLTPAISFSPSEFINLVVCQYIAVRMGLPN
jgi:hypothetical protein